MSGEELRIPKIPVTVELALYGEAPRSVELYIAEHQADAFRRQQVLDLLETDALFLPAHDRAAGDWAILNKATVAWVAISLLDGELPVEEAADYPLGDEIFDVRRRVEVELSGGEVIAGELLYSPPRERSRLADHLNEGGRFFRLWNEDRVYLVNKQWVLRVRELASGAGETD